MVVTSAGTLLEKVQGVMVQKRQGWNSGFSLYRKQKTRHWDDERMHLWPRVYSGPLQTCDPMKLGRKQHSLLLVFKLKNISGKNFRLHIVFHF